MAKPETHFTRFKTDVDDYTRPEQFTFPFYYQPHPLCKVAVLELQAYLERQTDWQHNFGLTSDSSTAIGKMFGVLLVENSDGQLGYLSAFSGKLANTNHLDRFVPPVFDMLKNEGFFKSEYRVVESLSREIEVLESNPELASYQKILDKEVLASNHAIQAHRAVMIEAKKDRKRRRKEAEETLLETEFNVVKEALSKESIAYKNALRDLTHYWQDRITQVRAKLDLLTDAIVQLKQQRSQASALLQTKLFDSYTFLNQKGSEKSLLTLFNKAPPAGAGECAAPKLLHYAFQYGFKPLAIAEFWWGASPKSEIRRHKVFYGACQAKCQPILSHMLDGLDVEDNPLLTNPGIGKHIEVVYEDASMVVINKPSELLSVPGKNIEDSVYTRMKQRFPLAKSPLIVHRLDMSTSGLMVIALTKSAHKNLQRQFITRRVEKRYIALLDGQLDKQAGEVNLPLRVDLDDRPRQLVCYEYGKTAETRWQLIEIKENKTRVYFYPKTGRTHQLRVHSAHPDGLNMPIVGDDLYGSKAERLHLHAESLTLDHPETGEELVFQIEPDF